MIDIFDFEVGISMKIKDVIGDLVIGNSTPELLGRIVEELVQSRVLKPEQLRRILPLRYEIRE
jgi:hypothetical protein